MACVRIGLLVVVAWVGMITVVAAGGPAEYVIHISVDGLAPRYLEALVEQGDAPNFKRLQSEGAWTHNARTDFNFTNTLPNHTSMVTGRPVLDKAASPNAILGHQWLINSDAGERTLHSNRHDYVASTFDVAHDNGLRTGLFASKSKFSVYDQSYDALNGAPDKTDKDNGRDKIDLYVGTGSAEMTDRFVEEMKSNPFHYSFVHFRDPDSAGHSKKWGSPEYNEAIKTVDGYLGRLLALVDEDPRLKGKTTLVLSADHGGAGLGHTFPNVPYNYSIPFYVWGAGVTQTNDLYSLNPSSRVDPKSDRTDFVDRDQQPIRNGDGGNLALKLLGLGPIPDSAINAAQDLNVK